MTDSELRPEDILKITNSLAEGGKIEAIKIYREATGKSLKEAKQFVDQLVPGLIEQDPERFAVLTSSGGGCASAVLFTAWFLAEVFLV